MLLGSHDRDRDLRHNCCHHRSAATNNQHNNVVSRTSPPASNANLPTIRHNCSSMRTSIVCIVVVFASLIHFTVATDAPSTNSTAPLRVTLISSFGPAHATPTLPSTSEPTQATPYAKYSESAQNYSNRSHVTTGNELWDGLVNECMVRPTMSCFQKNVYSYLDGALQSGDVNVAGGLRFLKNRVDAESLTGGAETTTESDVDEEEARSGSPIEEVTDALSGKGVRFLMTHDMELRMPETLFDGATVRISPRSFEGNGALVHFEIVPKEVQAVAEESRTLEVTNDSARIIFKPLKKIKKLFRSKLLLAFLAIVVVIKLIKIKLMWVLPFLVGVGAAKKLVLKLVLFLFPALAHVFKLCAFYHKNYNTGTKYHHHQHNINHLHTVVPPWFNEAHPHSSPPSSIASASAYSHHDPELIYTSPPKGHPSEYIHGGPPLFEQHAQDWETSGPGLGSEYINDRNAHVNSYKSNLDEYNEVSSLGLVKGAPQPPHHQSSAQKPPRLVPGHPGYRTPPLSPNQSVNPNPFGQPPAKILQQANQYNRPVYAQPQPQQPQAIPQQYATVTDQKMLREAQRLQAKQLEALRIQAEQKLVAQQQHILQQQPFVQNVEQHSAYLDPVYSPLLQRIDKVMIPLGFTEESCKERLICSMYKNPMKYSPHSNFVSAELSRDPAELQKPAATNPDVVRFYRYVQAARDGQEQRECLQIYGQCTINTE